MDSFQSERLSFRLITRSDYERVAQIFTDSVVMRYVYFSCIREEDEMRAFFQSMLENEGIFSQCRTFTVYDKTGYIGLALILESDNPPQVAEIGYLLLTEAWGKGYATEIARRLTDICFTQLGMQKVNASCNALNATSERVMQKIGMQREGLLRLARYKEGQWFDELRYGIERDEWMASGLTPAMGGI